MKKKLQPAYVPGLKRFIFFLLFFAFCNAAKAQTTVSGRVLDENNQPVSGVTVQVKNTNRATVTDPSGRFKINAAKTDVLVFSYVGSETQEETVGNRNSINIRISGTAKNLGEIVVTALGITKQARGLGYSTTNVNPDELSVNRTPNIMNALQGKVAGVNITSLGTGPGGTSKIRIRGQSSISGQNNPLIVINGVPVDNTNFDDATIGVTGGGVYADGGDGLSSINPDDIESMSILKGAPASALVWLHGPKMGLS